MRSPIITLTTDFGLKDSYVAEMKAVILSISPNVNIIDVTHEIDKFNTRMGAFLLASAAPYFPKGTIHVAVVDPGVGTERHPLIIQTKQNLFVGPDNGVLTLAAENQGIEHVYEIRERKTMLREISNTFHGRDVFAPAAAHLANGKPPTEFGPEIHEVSTLKTVKPIKRKGVLVGEVIHIDDFGNVITNLGQKELEQMSIRDRIKIRLAGTKLDLKLCKAYDEVKTQEPLATIGSHKFVEIAINQGNAANTLKIKVGDEATLYRS